MIRQLSIFAENKKGAMNRITQILYDAKINMNTLITNDSAEFGIIRMLVSDTDKAAKVLQDAGYMCHSDYVAAAEISESHTFPIFLITFPARVFSAACKAASPCAEITFITPSACERSILPFINALRVNSPGPAGTAPSASTRRSSFWVTNSPPWQHSSATSSPV